MGLSVRWQQIGSPGALRLLVAAAFLFLLLYSAPHRVHHFFENASSAKARNPSPLDVSAHNHDHDHHGAPQQPLTNSAGCAVLSLAQNAHAFMPALLTLPVHAVAWDRAAELTVFSTACFNPSPFSQRAPPLL
jgi:hypothetical protein